MRDCASWKRMGEEGFVGANAPKAYGGAAADFLYDAIVMEELSYLRAHGLMMLLDLPWESRTDLRASFRQTRSHSGRGICRQEEAYLG